MKKILLHLKNLQRELFYDSIANEFDNVMNQYEFSKRLYYVFNVLLDLDLKGKKLLDAGCGTGWFSKEAVARGAKVTSLDVGQKLLKQTAKKCQSEQFNASVLDLPFKDNSFDVVICTEVIEHTPNPKKALRELSRVVKPGGTLVVTTPNKNWKFSLIVANLLKIRPYYGLENWISYSDLKQTVIEEQIEIKKGLGFNIIPFFHPVLQPLINSFDFVGRLLPELMVNIAIVGNKRR